jgi:alkylation response protein AidB-like acyl-CoA dehydrogenase
VIFDEVEVGLEAIVGGEERWNQGWQLLAGPGLDVEKLEVSAMALGLADAAVDDAWIYAESREQFGRPISSYTNIRHMLADAKTELLACRLLLGHAAALAQEGKDCSVESSMAKLFICERAKQIVLNCQLILGAYGCDSDFDMQRYVRDILILPIAGGSSAIQRNNLAKRLRLRLE